jgi:hypothetical protein
MREQYLMIAPAPGLALGAAGIHPTILLKTEFESN